MMMRYRKQILFVLYTLTLAAILYYPASTVCRIEFPSKPPAEFRFKVKLYDPYDPLRGRYVRLTPLPDEVKTGDRKARFDYRDTAYAVLAEDKSEFAVISRLEKDKKSISAGEVFIPVSIRWSQKVKNGIHYHIELPFKRFYLNEFKAPQMEENLRRRSKGSEMTLTVKIMQDGFYAVSGLE